MFDNTYLALLYLASCEINQIKPDSSRIKQMDLASVHRMAKKHLLVVITYMGIEASDILQDEGWKSSLSEEAQADLQKWKQEKEKGVRKNLLLDVERQKLFAYLEEEHIWYMPLKGSVLKDYYPGDGMRQMADNDILYDAPKKKLVRAYFEQEGFDVISYDKGIHDVYRKKPIYNFEMHTSLFGLMHNNTWYNYYIDVKEKLIKDDDRAYGYHFSDNDFYIYFVTHTCKHYEGYGTGIRSLLDCYVCQKSTKLDWTYIEQEMDKLGIAEFERVLRSASFKLFSPDGGAETLTAEEAELVTIHASAGTYGTQKIGVGKKLRKLQEDDEPITFKTKWKYYLTRLIPPMEYYRLYYPTIYKLKFPIPFFVIYRIIRSTTARGRQLLEEIKIVWDEGK